MQQGSLPGEKKIFLSENNTFTCKRKYIKQKSYRRYEES